MKEKKLIYLATICACLVLFTCEKYIERPRNMGEVEEKTSMQQRKPKVAWPDGTEVFFIVREQRLIPAQKNPPENFYIKGLIEKGEFVPKTGVLGADALAEEGRHGWFELNTRNFFGMETGREPKKPYIKGIMTKQGFIPSEKTVFSETGHLR